MADWRCVQLEGRNLAPIDGQAITQLNTKERSMFTKVLVAAVALTAAVVTTAPAQAKTHIDIGIGLGFGGWGGGYGGYGGGYVPVYGGGYDGISCWKAKKIVQYNGFHNVYATDCDGYVMRFKGTKWGDQYRIKVNRSGSIVDVDHL
jgi:hypothetical protein